MIYKSHFKHRETRGEKGEKRKREMLWACLNMEGKRSIAQIGLLPITIRGPDKQASFHISGKPVTLLRRSKAYSSFFRLSEPPRPLNLWETIAGQTRRASRRHSHGEEPEQEEQF
jgi:hypothetical protein